jgi:hypothetical protein
MVKRAIVFLHRWLGVALCVLVVLWFASGIGMMYWQYPDVGPEDLLERSPALDPSAVVWSPSDAYAVLGETVAPGQVRLGSFDGRPVYRFGVFGQQHLVYADTGERQQSVTTEMMRRIASSWSGKPAADARVERVREVDQWTVQYGIRGLDPLWKYSWPSGEQVYFSEAAGEVVQFTTTASRLGAYLGPIPHWLYFTPLRKHARSWGKVVVWSSGIVAGAALLGLVVGIWMYSPSRRYRRAGAPTAIPYRGQKRWHMVLGLAFGIATMTWAFSGMLSMDPFPLVRGEPGLGEQTGNAIELALTGRVQLPAFTGKHPREALLQLAPLPVKELELTSFDGEPVYLATLAGSATRIVPVQGAPSRGLDERRIVDLVTTAAQPVGLADIQTVAQYDAYYRDRRRELPLPVIRALVNDEDGTRVYINPATGRVVATYSSRQWVSRWVYHGLHSFDFPWLYNYRPAWDIVVITFMLGGTALGVTSLVLAWQVLGRQIRRLLARTPLEPVTGEDVA